MSNENYSQETAEAISAINMSLPFFASLLYDLMVIKEVTNDPQIKTAGTDDKTIWINPDWFGKMPVPQRAFVLCHEIMHAVFSHMHRSKGYMALGNGPDHKKFSFKKMNIAQDYVINALLKEAKAGVMPKDGWYSDEFTGDDYADDVYCRMADGDYDDDGTGAGSGSGDGDDGGSSGVGAGGFDSHVIPSASHGDDLAKDLEAKTERAIRGAITAAKAIGRLPGCIERVMGTLLEPRVPWKEILRSTINTTMVREDTTWRRPNRRALCRAEPVVMPGPIGFACGEVVVQIDTSGSVSEDELSAFMSEVAGIFTDAKPEKIHLLWVDAKVAGHDALDNAGDLTSLKPKGGGGTDMRKGFDWVRDNGVIPDTHIIMTDGYTPWPEDAPPYSVVVVCTSDQDTCPFGVTIKLDL